ncbi:MAG: zf-HC2 domain-containing protein [Burkholderiaceae bacterium]|nr:zf-HC2 domain-containing protein [Burkholderiaceae bacterium]
MLSCKEVTAVCSAEMERPLKLGEKVLLRTHLMMCTGCTNYRQQMKALRQVVQAYADGKAVSVEPGAGVPE